MEAADVVADVAQPGRGLVGREPRFEGQHVPGRRGVTGELHGVAAFRPRSQRVVAVDAALLGPAEAGEGEPSQPTRGGLVGIGLVDEIVRGDMWIRRPRRATAGAVVQPPLANALPLERSVHVQVGPQVRGVGPVPMELVAAVRGKTACLLVGGGELRVVAGDRRVDVQRHRQALLLGPVQEPLRVGEQCGAPVPAVPCGR